MTTFLIILAMVLVFMGIGIARQIWLNRLIMRTAEDFVLRHPEMLRDYIRQQQ